MNDGTPEQIESQLAAMRPTGAPSELRGTVLADVRRELRASRWDQRMARFAAVLLIVGVVMNLAVGMKLNRDEQQRRHVAEARTRQSLVDTAVVVAEATDARTGSDYAKQLATMMGHVLTKDDAAAIDAAVRLAPTTGTNQNKG
jgi:hypothetical protein